MADGSLWAKRVPCDEPGMTRIEIAIDHSRMAEALVRRGIEVTVAELSDRERRSAIVSDLKERGILVHVLAECCIKPEVTTKPKSRRR